MYGVYGNVLRQNGAVFSRAVKIKKQRKPCKKRFFRKWAR
jgi:hypothetical protein